MKVLIAFDTKHGTSAFCAQRIAERLEDSGAEVTVADLREKVSAKAELSGYDIVVLGAPFYMGRWGKRALAFAKKRELELSGKRMGIFAIGAGAELGDRAAIAALPASVQAAVASSVFLGGRFDYTTLNFFERVITKAVTGKAESSSTLCLDKAEDFISQLLKGIIR